MKNAVSSAQTFKAPLEPTYEALVEALGSAGLVTRTQDAETFSLKAFWVQGAAQFTLAAVCTQEEAGKTRVTLTHRADLTPLLKKPAADEPIVRTTLLKKMDSIFQRLAQALGMETGKPAGRTVKFLRLSPKMRWIDWLSFFALGMPLVALLHSRLTADSGYSLALDFGAGLLLWLVYRLSVRKAWQRLMPGLYREWVCSHCASGVSERDAQCPVCGEAFGQITEDIVQVSEKEVS